MPANLKFFTAVEYGQATRTWPQTILEKVDHYFYLGGKKAHLIPGKTKNGYEKALLSEKTRHYWKESVKYSLILPCLFPS